MHTVDINDITKVLTYCPYYDEIINYDIECYDELSFDLIDWYKDLIFSCDIDIEKEIIKLIDKSMYLYVNNNEYRKGLRKIISLKDIDLNSDKKTKRLIKKILDYTNKYEINEVLNITSSRWI